MIESFKCSDFSEVFIDVKEEEKAASVGGLTQFYAGMQSLDGCLPVAHRIVR